MRKILIAGVIFGSMMASCASVPQAGSPNWMSLLRDALTKDPNALEEDAVQGNARAQYSIGLVYEHGLQGVTRDIVKGAEYKRRAVASRGHSRMTQYIPGVNGAPGRTAVISTPKFGVDTYEARYTDDCAQSVADKVQADVGARSCGNLEIFLEISALWK